MSISHSHPSQVINVPPSGGSIGPKLLRSRLADILGTHANLRDVFLVQPGLGICARTRSGLDQVVQLVLADPLDVRKSLVHVRQLHGGWLGTNDGVVDVSLEVVFCDTIKRLDEGMSLLAGPPLERSCDPERKAAKAARVAAWSKLHKGVSC